jgi:LPXTG-motif cell wall-anchored protein
VKPRKPWIKKVLLIAVIAGVIGAGVGLAAEMDRPDYKEAFNHAKQSTQQYMSKGNDKALAGQGEQHEKGVREGGHEHHNDGMETGTAIGGIVLAAGLLFWIIRRRKRNGGTSKTNSTHTMISTSDFLDQWENKQTNSKETN